MSSEYLRHLVGSRIRAVRKQKKMTQENLADRTGLQATYIGGVERSERNISVDSLQKVLEGLETTAAEFFRFGEESDPSLTDKKLVMESLNALLVDRSQEEVSLIHKIAKEMFATYDRKGQE